MIQTLYMTPEFRKALYSWSFEEYCKAEYEKKKIEYQEKGTEINDPDMMDYECFRSHFEKASIPRQLQKLFLKLNTSDKRSVKTKSLTKSFGWEQSEAFVQQDVQELCRLLLDSLDMALKGTELSGFIHQLYQGTIKDYVRCTQCGYESSRQDEFLDLSLVIRSVTSLEEALNAFISPELLNGDNQYFCEKCNKKNDAIKGLTLNKMPYLLSLQLKRFDYDPVYQSKVKLNGPVSFPEVLDLNPFVNKHFDGLTLNSENDNTTKTESDKGNAKKNDKPDVECVVEPYDVPEFDNSSFEVLQPNITNDQEEGMVIEDTVEEPEKQTKEATLATALNNGPNVYQLFSILIHRGSAFGGHYYAYIKSFQSGKWFEFNDSVVTEIEEKRMEAMFNEAYGEKETYSSFSGTNAYLLMYRRYDPAQNIMEPSMEDLPEAVKESIEAEKRSKQLKEEEKKKSKSLSSLRVWYGKQSKDFKFEKEKLLKDVVEEIVKQFGLESYFPNNLRLREYSDFHHIPLLPLVEEMEQPLSKLSSYYSSHPKHIAIETKSESEQFIQYKTTDLFAKVYFYDEASSSWEPERIVGIPKKAKCSYLKTLFGYKCSIPIDRMKITILYSYKPKLLKDDDEVPTIYFDNGSKIFVEPMDDDKEPRAFEEIARIKNQLEVSFTNPDEKEFVHKLTVDKRISVLDFKAALSKVIQMDPGEFRIYSKYSWSKTELKSDTNALSNIILSSEAKIMIEKGKPGDIKLKFYHYDLIEEEKVYLFDMTLPGTFTIKDVKTEFMKHWNSLQSNETKNKITLGDNPEKLRMRDLSGTKPSTIYMDDQLLKEVGSSTSQDIYVQRLEHIETKVSEDIVIIVLRRFHPDTYSIDPPIEFEAYLNETIAEFRKRISDFSSIPVHHLSLSIHSNYNFYSVLDFPSLKWIPRLKENPKKGDDEKVFERLVRSVSFYEGDTLLITDLSVPLKQLSEAEEKQVKDNESRKRQAKASKNRRKEDKLDIKIVDISLNKANKQSKK
uniref:Ubiquitin carboxyl-terminal hydrolase 47 n=1 Tax=Arcella intermedia TaxID=1963864 RepID=A0A6B2KX25_9EUKA